MRWQHMPVFSLDQFSLFSNSFLFVDEEELVVPLDFQMSVIESTPRSAVDAYRMFATISGACLSQTVHIISTAEQLR